MAWTFLVVDGSEAQAQRTVEQLNRLQPAAEVLVAGSGEAALSLLEAQRLVPSLVFVDYAMPGMNGVEFLAEVRGKRWLEGVPVAMLTAALSDRLVINCYRFGACAFLTKPVQLYEMRETLRDYARPMTRMTAATVVPATTGARESTTKTAA
jgi:CheY-like chemotaxis protein